MNESQRTSESTAEAAGKLLLRVTIAGLMLFHGVAKLQNGVSPIEEMLSAEGLPTFIAYGVYVGEVVVPILMIIGIFTRVSAIVFAFNMLVAILLAHQNEIFALGMYGEWAIELQLLYLVGGLVIALIGPGRFSVSPRYGVWA